MNVHRLLVTISADGTVSARTQGLTGTSCLDHVALLEDLLAARTTASEHTEEHLRSLTAGSGVGVGMDVSVDVSVGEAVRGLRVAT